MARTFGRPVALEKPEGPKPAVPVVAVPAIPRLRASRFGLYALLGGVLLSLFWVGVAGAFIWGLLGPQGLLNLNLAAKAATLAGMLLPPFLFLAVAAALARSAAMTNATRALLMASERLFAADETTANNAARLARAIRRELDGLNSGLDAAFQRMRTMEAVLEKQISTLDDAGARAAVRSDTIATRLNKESARIEALGDHLNDAAGRAGESMGNRTAQLKAMMEAVLEKQLLALDDAGDRAASRGDAIATRLKQEGARIETLGDYLDEAAGRAGENVAGRAAQIKAMMESAEGTLKMATQTLDVQAAGFRAAITQASEAPLDAAKSLEVQAARIQEVSDTAMGRAEFVLARHEKHRVQMGELVQRLTEESEIFETALSSQRTGMENAVQALTAESRKFEMVTGDAERHLELIMSNAANRATQLTSAFAREAERLKESGEAASAVLASLSAALKDAGTGAQTLIGESAAQAKHDTRLLVGEAMAECERLLRASGEMSAEAGKIRALLSETTKDVEKHLIRLPGLAQEEARRVRQMMAAETEQILDLSARTMSTLHARSTAKVTPPDLGGPMKPVAEPEPESEGLKGLARKLTSRGKTPEKSAGGGKAWEMKTLLAAAEQESEIRLPVKSGAEKQQLDTAAILGALELALADMAIDLSALDDTQPSDEDWKRYLAGDRAMFARRLSGMIDDSAVDRITDLYRDDKRFHNAADAYLAEFETLLTRAREGDGGGLLTSTLLSADTGKVYLTIAYALGRL